MCEEAKVNTISFYNSINIRYKLDTDQSKNHLPFHLFKRLFPKVDNTYIRPKMCKVKLRYNEKERICKFFVVQNGSMAVLGMQDIDRLGSLSINLKSRRQVAVAEENNYESQRQTNSDKSEQLKDKLQETETQNKQDARDANPTVMGNNSKKSIASFSEVLISQNIIADAER